MFSRYCIKFRKYIIITTLGGTTYFCSFIWYTQLIIQPYSISIVRTVSITNLKHRNYLCTRTWRFLLLFLLITNPKNRSNPIIKLIHRHVSSVYPEPDSFCLCGPQTIKDSLVNHCFSGRQAASLWWMLTLWCVLSQSHKQRPIVVNPCSCTEIVPSECSTFAAWVAFTGNYSSQLFKEIIQSFIKELRTYSQPCWNKKGLRVWSQTVLKLS